MADILIENFIPHGKNNAVTRLELHILTGLSDRDIREEICKAKRERGCCIINNGEGYFHPTIEEYEELKTYIAKEESRAVSIFDGLKPLKAFLEDIQRGRFDEADE